MYFVVCPEMMLLLLSSLPIGSRLPLPPTLEIHRRSINTQVLQSPIRKMAIVRPLCNSLRIVAFGVS